LTRLKLSQFAERKFGLTTYFDQSSAKLKSKCWLKYVLRPNFRSANSHNLSQVNLSQVKKWSRQLYCV